MTLKDDFNEDKVNDQVWREYYGGEVGDKCSHVVSGNSFTFDKVILSIYHYAYDISKINIVGEASVFFVRL